jgi:ABC-2 type transport system permease protein
LSKVSEASSEWKGNIMPTALHDISTIMWKEWREILADLRAGRGIRLFLIVGLISLLLPLRQGSTWVNSPLPIFFDGFYIPFAVLITAAANAFAGERERHTLETLLASRLSDRAILLGKIAALALYGWAGGILAAVLQLVVVNVTTTGGPYLYSGTSAIGIIFASLLLSTVIVAVGNLISQRAPSVQQAQQLLTLSFFLIATVPFVITRFLTGKQLGQIFNWASTTAPSTLLMVGITALVVVAVILVGAAMASFRRTTIFHTR